MSATVAAAAAAVGSATREVQWNVTPLMVAMLYGSMAVALLVFAYGVWRRVRVWRLGRPARAWDQPGRRLRRLLVDAVGQAKLLRERVPGVMHALVFFGFAVLFMATVVVLVQHDLGIPIMHGPFYLYFQSLTVDLFGLFVLIGVAVAGYRRYVAPVERLEHGGLADGLLLGSIALIVLTGLVLEGIRIDVTHDVWGPWAPAGYVTGKAIAALGLGDGALRQVHSWLWVFHVVCWHVLLATVPFTKLLHAFTAPLNIYVASQGDARSPIPRTDFEAEPLRLGIRSPFDMSWTQLLSLDACTECGRCQAVCPAFAEDKPLSPKRVILDLRDHVHRNAPELLEAGAALRQGDRARHDELLGAMPPLAGGVIDAQTLWACTTCRACEEACPVAIGHLPLIVGMRQNLAMEQAAMPDGAADAVGNLETRGQPFGGTVAGRADWYGNLPVRTLGSLAEGEQVEVVYWVGCAVLADERAKRVARALVQILDRGGVSFAVLGPEERCCGDPVRRTGNEYHFDLLAKENVETLEARGVKRIVTHCPHCLETLAHGYREYGGRYEVVHHSQLVLDLIETGRVTLRDEPGGRLVFHDPCYLGRHNGIFDAPRNVLDRLGGERVEMGRSREGSFCCGAGGGHAFYADPEGGKINQNRAREAVATGADTVCTGCPFCLAMLEDGVKAVRPSDSSVAARDLAELVADRLA